MTNHREGHRDNPALPRLTTRTVNRALARAGMRGEIHQGNGYLYFTGPDFDGLYSSSVYVCWLNDLSLSAWIDEARQLMQDGGDPLTRALPAERQAMGYEL